MNFLFTSEPFLKKSAASSLFTAHLINQTELASRRFFGQNKKQLTLFITDQLLTHSMTLIQLIGEDDA